jgi:hypothetical protein
VRARNYQQPSFNIQPKRCLERSSFEAPLESFPRQRPDLNALLPNSLVLVQVPALRSILEARGANSKGRHEAKDGKG